MKTTNVIRNRKSIREYASKDVKKSLLEELLEVKMKSLSGDLKYGIYMDGENAYLNLDGKVGYYGKMIKAPHYIYILAKKEDNYMESTGYLGERLSLKAADLGLGTCWIDIKYDTDNDELKSILEISSDMILTGLIALGYPKKNTSLWTIFKGKGSSNSMSTMTVAGYPNIEVETVDKNTSGRLAIGDIVYIEEFGNKADYKTLENRGLAEIFYYVRMAPSWGNRQPWKFVVYKSGIELYMRKDEIQENTTKLEAGVAMLYFELATHEMGIPGNWNLARKEDRDEYYFIGTYNY